jgi:hypothetical protein
MTRSRHVNAKRKCWTAAELALLHRRYPDEPAVALARELNCSVVVVYRKAKSLGLRKSEAFMSSHQSGRLRPGSQLGINGRFKTGIVPANKGLRRPGYAPGRMAQTQFKKGQRGNKFMPVGSERINADGYLDRKVSATGYPPRDWKGVHRLVWEAAYGPVPPKHAVMFRPGRRSTIAKEITLDALELVTRQELMRRNSYHTRYPKEIGLVIQARGQLVRRINKLTEKVNEKQDG